MSLVFEITITLSGIDEGTLVRAVRFTSRTIYGPNDHRKDWYEINDADVKSLARASVALFDASATQPAGNKITLKTTPLMKAHRVLQSHGADLCASEKFATQPTAAFCSGTLVRPDAVLTAGHCVSEISKTPAGPAVKDIEFVFGYWMKDPASPPVTMPAAQVFGGKEVLGGEMNGTNDWALVTLDRPVPASIAVPVSNWELKPVQTGQKVFVIGYPSGIPLKYAPGAQVRDISNPGYFKADLDTFGGNSGSGVYDQATKKLVGVLVKGDTDYKKDPAKQCMIAHVCPRYSDCLGEDVTRVSVVTAPQ